MTDTRPSQDGDAVPVQRPAKRVKTACKLSCGGAAIHVFNVDGGTFLLANDVMRATGNRAPSSSVEHAVSTFPELKVEGATMLRSIEGMPGKAYRLLSIEAATALVARSRSRLAIDVQRWLLGTFGSAGSETPTPSFTGPELAVQPVPAHDLVRLELTVTIAKARRILAIAAR